MEGGIALERYNPLLAGEWDGAVGSSRNGTFLLLRSYMDYHTDRFVDLSLIARDNKGRILALLPACRRGDTLCSHAGLTYGGWIMTDRCTVDIMDSIWAETVKLCLAEGIDSIVYKPVPHIFHSYPAEEDLFYPLAHGARITKTQIATVIDLDNPIPYDENARRGLKRAWKAGVTYCATDDYDSYWAILSSLLKERFDTAPVHSLEEIRLLAGRFPDNIKLYGAYGPEGSMIAGTVVYITKTAAHAQYIAASPKGKELRALPGLFREVMAEIKDHGCRYFDFGTSNEPSDPSLLNLGLIRQKTGMGGRAIVFPTLTLDIQSLGL